MNSGEGQKFWRLGKSTELGKELRIGVKRAELMPEIAAQASMIYNARHSWV